jgi:murein DD-endopeptidase MepM/ murein hydrolase activator NlpD
MRRCVGRNAGGMIRLAAAVLVGGLTVAPVTPVTQVTPSPVVPSTGGATEVVAYVAPVAPVRVVRQFAPPANRYGPGNRGVDLAASAAGIVLAAGAGRVTFAGQVAGRGVVVVEHADGVRTEYEPVSASVRVGATVSAAQPIGRLAGTHGGCTQPCLHWGARYGGEYLDPMTLLEPLGVVRLLPW